MLIIIFVTRKIINCFFSYIYNNNAIIKDIFEISGIHLHHQIIVLSVSPCQQLLVSYFLFNMLITFSNFFTLKRLYMLPLLKQPEENLLSLTVTQKETTFYTLVEIVLLLETSTTQKSLKLMMNINLTQL